MKRTLRIICLPYAGGGVSAYARLRAIAPPGTEVIAVQLPGRESRYAEPPLHDWAAMDSLLRREVFPLLTDNTVVYGHSMGALIGYRLCLLAERFGVRPRALCVGAHRSPDEAIEHNVEALDDRQLLAYISALSNQGEFPSIAEELLPLVMPAIRADLVLCENFTANRARRLDIPLLAVYGRNDSGVTGEHMAAWCAWADGPYRLVEVAGDHLFIRTDAEELLKHLLAFVAETAGLRGERS